MGCVPNIRPFLLYNRSNNRLYICSAFAPSALMSVRHRGMGQPLPAIRRALWLLDALRRLPSVSKNDGEPLLEKG